MMGLRRNVRGSCADKGPGHLGRWWDGRPVVAATSLAIILAGFGVTATSAVAGSVSTWAVIPSPNPGVGSNVLDAVSCASSTSCVAVGSTQNGAVLQTLVETWDGQRWSVTPSPSPSSNDNSLDAVSCVSSNSCMAVGSEDNGPLVEAWDGTTWSVVATPGLGAELLGVSCTTSTNCVAVGSGEDGSLVEAWDGTTWSVTPSPNPNGIPSLLDGVSCVSPTSCLAVGFAGGPPVAFAETWDGASWSATPIPIPSPGTSTKFTGVSCTTSTDCVVVGEEAFSHQETGPFFQTLVETWDGSSFVVAPSPDASNLDHLYGVSCASSTSCVAVGSEQNGSSAQTLVETWGGNTWSITPSPSPSSRYNSLGGVSCAGSTSCLAVGSEQNESVLQTNETLTESSVQAPAITSGASTTFEAGQPGSFMVTTTGLPSPTLIETGPLPSGVSFVDNGDGTATVSGTPAEGTGGLYPVTMTASNGFSPDASQSFALTINDAPRFTAASPPLTATAHRPYGYTFVAGGFPPPTYSLGGSAPSWLSVNPATGAVSGTVPTRPRSFTYAVSATNSVGSTAVGPFTVVVSHGHRSHYRGHRDHRHPFKSPLPLPARTGRR